MAALGLHCWARAFSSCGEWGLLFVAVCGLLIAVASLCCGAQALGARASVVVTHGLSCSTATNMWDLPRPGLEPVSPALAGGVLTTAPTGKSHSLFLLLFLPSLFHSPRSPLLPGLLGTQILVSGSAFGGIQTKTISNFLSEYII